MTLAEVQASLAFAKAAYNAALKGNSMTWEGRSITLSAPDIYWSQIIRLERVEAQINSGRKGHSTSLADLSSPK